MTFEKCNRCLCFVIVFAALFYYAPLTKASTAVPLYTTSGVDNTPNKLSIRYGANMAHGVFDQTGRRLFVSDANNNRVLIFNLGADGRLIDRVPDAILGQPDFRTSTAATTQSGLSGPRGVAYDSVRQLLFVADISNHRVLIFDVAEITNGESATAVLGQSLFTTGSSANTQTGMNAPAGLAYDSTNKRLFVSQYNSNRISIFDITTIDNGESAINVLGQSDFVSTSPATGTGRLRNVIGIDYDPMMQYLYVGDTGNARVMIFDTTTITDGEDAVYVLGQPHFTSSTAVATQAGLKGSAGVTLDTVNRRLFVGDFPGNRIPVFDITSLSNGMNATNVLGQTTFTGSTASTTQSGFVSPYTVAFDVTNNYFYCADTSSNRLLVFDTTTIANGELAVDMLGQYDDNLETPGPIYTKSSVNNVPSILGFNAPKHAVVDAVNHRFFQSDTTNNRVLVFNLNSNNQLDDLVADHVLGQADFHTKTAATTQVGMSSPQGLAYDATNNRLFVAQNGNHRVSVYAFTGSISNGMSAANILGQATFTASSAATTQVGMSSPQGLAYDATNNRLFVAQSGNHRVSVFDTTTIVDGEDAVNLLGQYDDSVYGPTIIASSETAAIATETVVPTIQSGGSRPATRERRIQDYVSSTQMQETASVVTTVTQVRTLTPVQIQLQRKRTLLVTRFEERMNSPLPPSLKKLLTKRLQRLLDRIDKRISAH